MNFSYSRHLLASRATIRSYVHKHDDADAVVVIICVRSNMQNEKERKKSESKTCHHCLYLILLTLWLVSV